MKPSSYQPNLQGGTAHQRGSSSGTGNVQTITLAGNTSAVFITVETTTARVTFDGSDPSAVNAPSMVIPAGGLPVMIPVGGGTVIKWCSTAAAASVLQTFEVV